MLVAISKEASFEGEKNLFDNSRMTVFKTRLESRLARGLAILEILLYCSSVKFKGRLSSIWNCLVFTECFLPSTEIIFSLFITSVQCMYVCFNKV